MTDEDEVFVPTGFMMLTFRGQSVPTLINVNRVKYARSLILEDGVFTLISAGGEELVVEEGFPEVTQRMFEAKERETRGARQALEHMMVAIDWAAKSLSHLPRDEV